MPPSGEETRQRLLTAAVEALLAEGWGGISTRGIAARAGVRPGLVHYHFGSIDALRRDAALQTLAEGIEPLIEHAAIAPPAETLAQIAEVSAGEYAPGTGKGNLAYEVLPAAVRDDVLQAALADMIQRFRDALATAIRRHHPHALLEPDVLAEIIAALVDGLQLHLLVEPDLDLPRHLAGLAPLLGPAAATAEETRS